VAEPGAVPEFHALLRTHRQRTGVPGLVNVPMLVDGVLAPTPRDAIRETYSSAADALVLGRFLIAKDYWLLRGRVATTGAR
jgi:predicted NodU family carbamoyl transferase